ncbi:NADH:flavin oxidoreductase, partial [bacterium]
MNRFSPTNPYVLAPMTTYSSQPDGVLSPDEEPYLERRAKAGYGTVTTAACAVHPSGKAFVGQWASWSDEFIPSLRRAA